MDFKYDQSIRETVKEVSRRFDNEYWRNIYHERRFPEEYWKAFAEKGLFRILLDKKLDGMQKGMVDLVIGTEQTAEEFAGAASYLFLSASLIPLIFLRNGVGGKQKKLLTELGEGRVKISIALAEESSGSFASGIKTVATRISADKFLINGSKFAVNNAERADFLLLFARTTPLEKVAKRSHGLSMFLVDSKDRSITRKKVEKLGFDFIDTFSLEIADLKVGTDDLMGRLDNAWTDMIDIFNMDRIATAASLVGIGKLAISRAISWVGSRSLYGKIIGSNQGIQFPLADAMAQLMTAEAMTLKAASLVDNGRSFDKESSYAFLESQIAASYATERSLQALGGHGYFTDFDVERYWRDVQLYKVHPIPEQLLLANIAENSLNLPRSY